MEEAGDPLKLIYLPSQILDYLVEILAKVGIVLPALMLQSFLLILVLLTFFVAARSVWADWRNAGLLPLLGVASMGLVFIGIVFGIVTQAALPNRLSGRVTGQELTAVKVDLLDFRGETVSTGGSADTETGEFIAYYSPAWNGRARSLRISSPSCKPQEHTIARVRLARGSESTWNFPCEKS